MYKSQYSRPTCSPTSISNYCEPTKLRRAGAHSVKYSDIFGPAELQWKVVKVMIRMLEICEDFLQKDGLPVGANTGPNFAISPL